MPNAPTIPTKKFSGRLLKGDEVALAQRLLYEVYVVEQNWVIKADNPSGLHIKASPFGPILADAFDATSHWVGAFCDSELVGVQRIVSLHDGHYELDLYHQIPHFLIGHGVECNRLAVKKDHRAKSPAVVILWAEIYRFLLSQGVTYAFGATHFPMPGEIYLKLGLKEVDIEPFKYDPKDETPVRMIYFDSSDPVAGEKIIRISERLISRMAYGA